ncbi:hypothetical protein PS9374_07007 [Planomonospora sphaerica]|uniref:Uncharacterized protein n=1 Tax=Planomonospora sphaerica TaxID=161355 RepID=A0A171DQH2_9ACTN|nr:hypothetical protein [Planomonospora sphaerica]GAT71316.1 hypothetical protein PS9374_07007 [Planomonospora sphaerica]
MHAQAHPEDLPGTFVTEIGQGRVEYFMTFCDNRPAPARRTRLYMDCDFRIEAGSNPELSKLLTEHRHPLAQLSALSNLTVRESQVNASEELVIRFDDDVIFTILNQTAGDDPHSYAEWRLTSWQDM